MPAYNQEKLIGATLNALDSAAKSVNQLDELIIVDDASNDQTAAVGFPSRALGRRLFSFFTHQAFETAGGFDEKYCCGEELLLGKALKRAGKLYFFRETTPIKQNTLNMGEYPLECFEQASRNLSFPRTASARHSTRSEITTDPVKIRVPQRPSGPKCPARKQS